MDRDECACGQVRQLTWSPAFSAYLCPTCLWNQTERALAPVTVLPPEAGPVPTLATGGYISPGTTCVVGERGPEVAVP